MQALFLTLAAIGVIATAAWIYGAARIGSGVFIKAQCHTKSGSGILLTFDDGPDPQTTPKVLDTLDKHGAKAIFFVIGEKAESHPDLVREIIRRGHIVGNHTMRHSHYANFLGRRHLESEIRPADAAIEHACGIRPRLFRPPLGISTHFMATALRHTGHSAVGWSIRSFDTRNEPRQRVLQRILRQLRPGAIVLLHDRMVGAEWLADEVLKAMEERGWEAERI